MALGLILAVFVMVLTFPAFHLFNLLLMAFIHEAVLHPSGRIHMFLHTYACPVTCELSGLSSWKHAQHVQQLNRCTCIAGICAPCIQPVRRRGCELVCRAATGQLTHFMFCVTWGCCLVTSCGTCVPDCQKAHCKWLSND